MPRQPSLSPIVLQAALEGLEAQRGRIDEQIAQVRRQLGQRGRGRPPKAARKATEPAKKKRTLSAAARRRISAAQKKRWAELKKKSAKG